MSKVVTKAGKDLLVNTIKIVQHQNKVKEESEMWKQYEKQKRVEKTYSSGSSTRSPPSPHQHKSSHSDKSYKRKRRDSPQPRKPKSTKSDDKYWLRKLYEIEEKDQSRWGHNGFKELYPEEFESRKKKHKSESKP